jgi:hypothetical protein
MRTVKDEHGREWTAMWVETVGAHMVKAATLAYRPVDDAAAEPLVTTVAFNSPAAAELALSTMSEKELTRRLAWVKTSSGVV